MQDTKVFNEIIKDSLEDLEKEISKELESLEKHLIKNYQKDPFRMSHVIDESSREWEGMITGVFFVCIQIRSRYFNTEQYRTDTDMIMNETQRIRHFKNDKCQELWEKYHYLPLKERMKKAE